MHPRPRSLALALGISLAASQAALATTSTLSFPNGTVLAFQTPSNDPDTTPAMILTPTVRFQTRFGANVPNGTTVTAHMQGAAPFSGPSGASLPLSDLSWDGTAVDTRGDTLFWPTGATTQADNPVWTVLTQFGVLGDQRNRDYFFDQRFEVVNRWSRPYGDYTGTIQYVVRENGTTTNQASQTFKLTVPPFLGFLGTPSTVTLTADPAEADPSANALAATLKANGHPGESTEFLIKATPLTDGTNAIPFANFLYRLDPGPWTPFAPTDQATTLFTGASAGTSANLDLKVENSWGHVPGVYQSTVTYGARFNATSVLTKALPSALVQVTVPARLQLSVDGADVNLMVDPADEGAENVASQAAVVTVKSNYPASTLYVSATTPASGPDTLPMSGFKFRINPSAAPVGGAEQVASLSSLAGDGAWAAFPETTSAIATLTHRTDGAVIRYDYTYDRSWTLKSATYTSTVTYTVAGN